MTMTREIAIGILDMSKHMATSGRLYNQAIDMAIEALSDPINENREIIKDILQMMPTAYLLEALGVATFDELMGSERTGEWLEVEVFHEVYDIEGVNTWGSEMQCDQCGFRHTAIEGHMAQYNFCPNCGAAMRGIQMKKPITFNYKKYEDLRNAYKELLEDNNKLMADNKLLREKVTNLQIKIRILEGNNEKS